MKKNSASSLAVNSSYRRASAGSAVAGNSIGTSGAGEKPGKSSQRVSAVVRSKMTADSLSGSFDPAAPELTTTWSSFAPVVCCVNAYPNGVTLSVHSNKRAVEAGSPAESAFHSGNFALRFKDTREYQAPQGKYFLFRDDFVRRLEEKLITLKQKGLLSDSLVIFGTTSDPFLSFHKKFDVTTRCLELFERYVPGRLLVQTRSPMVISALPTLRRLRENCLVVVPIESHQERSIVRYTPGMPRIAERLVATEGMRRQGIPVTLSVSPILPYGDYYRDAWDFAELLDHYADYITLGCLASGSQADERALRMMPVARKLAADKEFQLLRPHAFKYLYHALKVLAPNKLKLPVEQKVGAAQLDLFAA